jgi:hypothetical protein
MKTRNTFTSHEIKAFEPAEKIGLVACVTPEGQVHVTLITSIMASNPQQITLGQFCMGRSKWYMQQKPEIGFLIMTMDKRLWRGKARWTHKRQDGPEYEVYNNQPMFRYNSYFGINTVHYLDLIETSGEERLPMGRIIHATVLTRFAKSAAATGSRERILKPFAENLFNKIDTLKFLAWIGSDGIPVIIPAIQCQASDSRRLVFSTRPFREELGAIPAGTTVGVFALNLKMQSVLVRGNFSGFRSYRGIRLGVMDIAWVYNSMPPCHDQIYPEWELKPVSEF